MITITLTPDQREKLMRPITGPRSTWGGFQHLCWRHQQKIRRDVDGKWQLSFTEDDGDRTIEYADDSHGPGGYQDRLRPIVPAVRQALKKYRAHHGVQGSFDMGE